MSEYFEKVLNVDAEQLHSHLREQVVEDTKENVKHYLEQGIFMGKVGAKKFYLLYKPPYLQWISFMTLMRGDIGSTDEGKTRLRYRFCKYSGSVVLASILMCIATVLTVYAVFSNQINVAGVICIVGFWLLGLSLYLYGMVATKSAKQRLVEFIEALAQNKKGTG